MAHEPNPALWPSEIAEYITRIRSLLRTPGQVLLVEEFIHGILTEEGFNPQMSLGDLVRDERVVRAAEIEFLVMEACYVLDRRGELWPVGGQRGGTLWTHLAKTVGWVPPNQYGQSVSSAYRATAVLGAFPDSAWNTFGTRWTNVDRLADQARLAWRDHLDVAAAVTARVAVEEAVESALRDVDPSEVWEPMKAWDRERELIEKYLTQSRTFAPLDREATKAALSAIRSLGNAAAHDGAVTHELLEDSFLRLMPQALMSLSAAVERKLRGAT